MDSAARKVLQVPFSEVAVGRRFQMANASMQAAMPRSTVFTKITELMASDGNNNYRIRPDWPCEVLNDSKP